MLATMDCIRAMGQTIVDEVQRLGGLLGGRGALVQGALGLLQGCIYAAQLGGDFGALPLQLVDLALGLALLVLQFFQFLLGFVVGLLGLILFCR